ncbi:MAG: hypothetical protein WCK02_09330 [Bacteroidota bacterium]
MRKSNNCRVLHFLDSLVLSIRKLNSFRGAHEGYAVHQGERMYKDAWGLDNKYLAKSINGSSIWNEVEFIVSRTKGH